MIAIDEKKEMIIESFRLFGILSKLSNGPIKQTDGIFEFDIRVTNGQKLLIFLNVDFLGQSDDDNLVNVHFDYERLHGDLKRIFETLKSLSIVD